MQVTTARTFVLCLLVVSCLGGKGKKYEPGEEVQLFVNTVGPYANPSEIFEYYSLPFCVPGSVQLVRVKTTIGMAIEGDRLFTSLYEHHFAGFYFLSLFCFFPSLPSCIQHQFLIKLYVPKILIENR